MTEKAPSHIRRATGDPFIAADGGKIFELFRPENSDIKNMSIASGTLQPGQKAVPHFHERSEEVYYVVFGSGMVTIDETTEDIKTGDAIHVPVGAVHGLVNTSITEQMNILAISSPAFSEGDIFFKK